MIYLKIVNKQIKGQQMSVGSLLNLLNELNKVYYASLVAWKCLARYWHYI